MNRQEYQRSIIKSLTWLSAEVKVNNRLNLTDINIHSENFYRDLLNLAFSYSLANINITEPNATAIDLGDESNGIAIQVTSSSALVKTRNTVEKFIEKALYKKYTKLIILNIAEKTAHKDPTVGNDHYLLNTKDDIWDIGTLATRINDFKTDQLAQVNNFLNKQLHIKPEDGLSKNVGTILKLIELLSDESHPAIGDGFLDEPFPEEKFKIRFSDHATFLEQEYLKLYSEYGAVLDAVEQASDIGQVKIRRVSQHLKVYSDQVLNELNGNPKDALAAIIQHFLGLLQTNNFEADTGAAQFYIMKHLVMCNVFPNRNKAVIDD